MRILFYGRLAESIAPEIELDVPGESSVSTIRQRLAGEYPSAANVLSSARALTCIDGALVRDDHLVTDEQVVEFLPPVSGG